MRHAGIRHDEEKISGGDWRRHVGDATCGAPRNFSFGLQCENVVVRIATRDEQQACRFVIHRRCDELLSRPIHKPVQVAVVWIVARHGLVA